MNVYKIFVLLVFLPLVGGCGHHAHHGEEGKFVQKVKDLHCAAPNRPSGTGQCFYAIEYKGKADRGGYHIGIIPKELLQYNGEQQGLEGTELIKFVEKFNTEENIYRLGVHGPGANDMKEGKIYWFMSRGPGSKGKPFKTPLVREKDEHDKPLEGIEPKDFKKDLEERKRKAEKEGQ
jgi:hypothetical protein